MNRSKKAAGKYALATSGRPGNTGTGHARIRAAYGGSSVRVGHGGGAIRQGGGTLGRPAAFWERVPDGVRGVRDLGSGAGGMAGPVAERRGVRSEGSAAPLGEGQPAGASSGSAVPLRFRFFFSPPASSGSAAGSATVESSSSGSRPGVAKLNFVIRNLKMK
ncbi:Uncharacterised protein [Mycobacterium tuberculosis]|nr:Uncharacterised protein [Mycobacterium tuberculosis]